MKKFIFTLACIFGLSILYSCNNTKPVENNTIVEDTVTIDTVDTIK